MTERRLILHLGWDAVTAGRLHRHLSANFAELRDAGVLYPATGRSPEAPRAHDQLGTWFRGGGTAGAGWPSSALELVSALRREIDLVDVPTVVLSDPTLCLLRESRIAGLGPALPGFTVEPVVVLRNFPDWLDQRYAAALLGGATDEAAHPGLVPGGFAKRLAAWAALAGDGKLHVIDADAAPSGDPLVDLLTAVGLDKQVPLPPPGPDPADSPPAPALLTLAREFRAQGVGDASISGLLGQLGGLRFPELQTNLSDEVAAELAARYALLFSRLYRAPFVRWAGTTDVPPVPTDRGLHIANSAAAVFALGRAIADLA